MIQKNKRFKVPFVTLCLLFITLFSMPLMVSASSTSGGTSSSVKISVTEEDEALMELSGSVQTSLSQKPYALEDGGNISGSDLFVKDDKYPNGGTSDQYVYTINEDNFNRLSNSAKTSFVSDIVEYSSAVEESNPNVSESTVDRWWKDLQSQEGVGSKFMMEILKNTKPDFVSANRIYKPFSGPVGIALGLGSVLICALLGVSIVLDIFYITIPPFRMFSEGSSNGKKGFTSHLISHHAETAVKEAEGGNGGSKQPLAIYFKLQAFQMIILGICLLYLVSGQLYTLVGWILDLLRGFLHF